MAHHKIFVRFKPEPEPNTRLGSINQQGISANTKSELARAREVGRNYKLPIKDQYLGNVKSTLAAKFGLRNAVANAAVLKSIQLDPTANVAEAAVKGLLLTIASVGVGTGVNAAIALLPIPGARVAALVGATLATIGVTEAISGVFNANKKRRATRLEQQNAAFQAQLRGVPLTGNF